MKKNNKLKIISSVALVSWLVMSSAGASSALANREICSPQDADMTLTGEFTTVCDWENWRKGSDSNALITLHGGLFVHAVCQFSGSDRVALVSGLKHSDFKPLVAPGNQFSFDIAYRDIPGSFEDNQNILVYLDTRKPGADDKLVCVFYGY